MIGASNDKTGNIKYGGDWIMESTSQDIEAVYFKQSIKYYSHLLDNPTNIQTLQIIWNNDPTIYAFMTLDIANTQSVFFLLPDWIYNFTLNIQGTIFNFSDFTVFAYSYTSPIDYTQPNLLPQFSDFNFFTFTLNPEGFNIFIFSYNESYYEVSNITLINYTCFKEDTKILTDQGYKTIQELRKGDLIKTLKHDFKPIDMIGKRDIYHPALQERIKDQLYKCSPEHFSVFEDLMITGCHSILVDEFKEGEREKTIEINGDAYVTENKYRLPACVDDRTTVYETPGTYTIYHFALENDDIYNNYGIYANGLLVESCSKRYLKELSNMTLIE